MNPGKLKAALRSYALKNGAACWTEILRTNMTPRVLKINAPSIRPGRQKASFVMRAEEKRTRNKDIS